MGRFHFFRFRTSDPNTVVEGSNSTDDHTAFAIPTMKAILLPTTIPQPACKVAAPIDDRSSEKNGVVERTILEDALPNSNDAVGTKLTRPRFRTGTPTATLADFDTVKSS